MKDLVAAVFGISIMTAIAAVIFAAAAWCVSILVKAILNDWREL